MGTLLVFYGIMSTIVHAQIGWILYNIISCGLRLTTQKFSEVKSLAILNTSTSQDTCEVEH